MPSRLRGSRLGGLDRCGNRIGDTVGGDGSKGGRSSAVDRGREVAAAAAAAASAAASYADPTLGGVDTISPGDGGLTPGSTFDASEVDRRVVPHLRLTELLNNALLTVRVRQHYLSVHPHPSRRCLLPR